MYDFFFFFFGVLILIKQHKAAKDWKLTVDCAMLTGKEGWAAPRLKDAVLSESKMRECYFEVRNPFSPVLER